MVEEQKENDKFRTEYLSMNLHDRDITRKAFTEGIEQGISQGAEQAKIETAKEALKNNISIEIISKITGLSLEKITEIQKEII
jgi:predicted transposase/invertase (TIGR01784 family)